MSKTRKKILRHIYHYSYHENSTFPCDFELHIHNPKENQKTDIWEMIHEDFEEAVITIDEVNR